MAGPERTVHSLAELHLYAAMIACRGCSTLGPVIVESRIECGSAPSQLRAKAVCEACGGETVLELTAQENVDFQPRTLGRIPLTINTTSQPSELLDASQWLTLYRIAVEAAERLADRQLSRAVLIEAGQCLAEALRFYPHDSDVPSASAFFAAETLQRFRDHPHLFARQRLIELAAKLPVSAVDPPASVSANRPSETKWWLR